MEMGKEFDISSRKIRSVTRVWTNQSKRNQSYQRCSRLFLKRISHWQRM